jgi:RNA polymerase sigma-70 factor (ECF subfamily)
MDDIEQVIEKTYRNHIGLFLSIGCSNFHFDLETSRDILHETFETLWSARQRLKRDELSVRKFALTTYHNKCIDNLRKQHVRKKSLPALRTATGSSADPLHVLLLIEGQRMISTAIEKLPSKCRQIVRLSLQGVKPREIVERLGIDKNKVRNLKHRCFGKLKQILRLLNPDG